MKVFDPTFFSANFLCPSSLPLQHWLTVVQNIFLSDYRTYPKNCSDYYIAYIHIYIVYSGAIVYLET